MYILYTFCMRPCPGLVENDAWGWEELMERPMEYRKWNFLHFWEKTSTLDWAMIGRMGSRSGVSISIAEAGSQASGAVYDGAYRAADKIELI